MKNLLLLLSLTIVFLSCNKEKAVLKYTGTLYKDCAKNPAANTEISVYQVRENNLIQKGGGELATGTTDALGNFSISFKDDNGAPIRIETINTGNPLLLGTIVIERLDPENIDLGELYINNRGNAYVFVEASNSYTSSDTLVWGYPKKKIAGPFPASPIDSTVNYYFIEKYNERWAEGEMRRITWAVNPTADEDFKTKYVKYSGCGIIDSFFINID